MSLVLQVFGHKPKYWMNLIMMMAIDEKLRDQSYFSIWQGGHECVGQISWQSHPIVVGKFLTRPKAINGKNKISVLHSVCPSLRILIH